MSLRYTAAAQAAEKSGPVARAAIALRKWQPVRVVEQPAWEPERRQRAFYLIFAATAYNDDERTGMRGWLPGSVTGLLYRGRRVR